MVKAVQFLLSSATDLSLRFPTARNELAVVIGSKFTCVAPDDSLGTDSLPVQWYGPSLPFRDAVFQSALEYPDSCYSGRLRA